MDDNFNAAVVGTAQPGLVAGDGFAFAIANRLNDNLQPF